jgi:hypothetical protein
MVNMAARKPKLLFVLSRDYGELASALDFLEGWDCDALLLAPAHLHGINEGGIAARVQAYATAGDVLAVVEVEKPDLVFLFSAYLYAVNNLFDLEQLGFLVSELRRRSCPAITSDPFLGLMSRIDGSTFSESHPLRSVLAQHFAQVYSTVEDLPHLYLVDPGGAEPAHRRSYFNLELVRPGRARLNWPVSIPGPVGVDPSRPRWLFVLSSEDYGTQILSRGQAEFDAELAHLLEHAFAQRRQPLLIAPSSCVAAQQDLIASGRSGAILLSHCGHALFSTLLGEAEHVFYWNLFSHSILKRVMNHRSAFFFSPGHLAQAIPPLLDAGIAHYYAGAQPSYLTMSQPPSAEELAHVAFKQDSAWEAARAQLRRSPAPAAVVAGLLGASSRVDEGAGLT